MRQPQLPHEPPQQPPPPKLGCPEVPCAANDMLNCFATLAFPQSGQFGSGSDMPTSSSKWDSQLMQTYS